jgi:asparagine synthetase B (glutamine-hydrolysing)
MLELEDRHGMSHSLEGRVPYLDHRIVEWVFRQPGERKVDPREDKRPLRDVIRAHVPTFPPSVLGRRKSPMPPPFDTRALFAEMRSALGRPGVAIERYVDRARLDTLLGELASDAGVVSARHYVVFALYTLERWFAIFAGGSA